MKPAPFCKFSAGLGSTTKSAISLFLLSKPRFFIATLCFSRSFKLPSLFFLYYPAKLCSPDTHFLRKTVLVMSWPGRDPNSCHLQCLVVSLLLPLVSTLLFTRTLVSQSRVSISRIRVFDQQDPLVSTEELVLLREARCVSSRYRDNGPSLLLNSYLSRIGRIKDH